ncbi:MAG: phosphoesterase [Candidatus Eremiobacteraeota bacterium]|nr:phosphoesterase [Candidatus Eremiobacteraeota bacterium]
MRRAAQYALITILLALGPAGCAFRGPTLSSNATAAAAIAPNTGYAQAALIAQLRRHVKHVFVIYQENHSFDEYFGTYPGADNLASAQARANGFRQYDPMGKQWVTPFRITDPDTDSPAHSRPALIAKMNGGRSDNYIARQEQDSKGYEASDARAIGLLTMSYYDCDTIPFLWKYAHAFALYDRFFQGMTGPSTPGNIEIIAAQTGQTQRARNPSSAVRDNKGPGVPVVSSIDPPFGPYPGKPQQPVEIDQRYATVLLTLNGRNDVRATRDTAGVRRDLALMGRQGRAPIPWGWYQEGYNGPNNDAALEGYEAHHNAIQYFGYMRKNDVFWDHVHDAKTLLSALRLGTLPERSVAYIKGGSHNHFGWRPANKDPFIQEHFLGDDDHPGADDSDRHIAQAFVATFVNAIARSRYWKDSAIIITWDDSGGFYDHVPSAQFESCPDGKPCGDGPRLPFILISPYAKSGAIVHDASDTASVVKFIDMLFGLPALSSLPDEKPYMPQGPRDASARLSDLTSGFDLQRLNGGRAAIPPGAAVIPDAAVTIFPPRMNCKSLGIQPVSLPGAGRPPPPGYAPRARKYVP